MNPIELNLSGVWVIFIQFSSLSLSLSLRLPTYENDCKCYLSMHAAPNGPDCAPWFWLYTMVQVLYQGSGCVPWFWLYTMVQVLYHGSGCVPYVVLVVHYGSGSVPWFWLCTMVLVVHHGFGSVPWFLLCTMVLVVHQDASSGFDMNKGKTNFRFILTGHANGAIQMWDLTTALDFFEKGEPTFRLVHSTHSILYVGPEH